MADEKKYQVFVSSTFQDLMDERKEVMQALLELNCIPSGMELFPAADEDQWTLIKGVIDDCDYYVVVIGGRYGSLGADGVSFTEMEYRYAVATKKPIIAFLHKDPSKLTVERTEMGEDGRAKLEAFRALAQKRTCKYWTTAHELGSVVSRGLVNLIRTHPAVGWIRADRATNERSASEILKLRKQIEKLETQLREAGNSGPVGTEELAQGDDPHSIEISFETRSPKSAIADMVWNDMDIETTWNEIFGALSPVLMAPVQRSVLSNRFDSLVRALAKRWFVSQTFKELKGHTLVEKSVAASDQDFETVLVQLAALGLIVRVEAPKGSKSGATTFWTLTPYGHAQMNRIRAVRREADETGVDAGDPAVIDEAGAEGHG